MSMTTKPYGGGCASFKREKCIHLVRCPGYESEDRDFPCMATGETDIDGAVLPVECDLWLGHADRHYDEAMFTFWVKP